MYQHILVPTDGSEWSNKAIRRGSNSPRRSAHG
jgi:nucleotide-binding universal stress UspA family protein